MPPAPNTAPNPVVRKKPRRWLRLVSQDALLLAILLLLALWWASGREGSLAWAVRQIPQWLPEGHRLEMQDVTGTLRHGGHIGRAQWRSPGLRIDVRDVHLAWQPHALLKRRLHIARLDVGEVALESAPQEAQEDAAAAPPSAPPGHLLLPLAIHLPFAVQRLHWQHNAPGGSSLELHRLKGSYGFDGAQHQLELAVAQQQNRWQGELRLHARAPMEVRAEVSADVQAADIPARLHASAQGQLAGEDAALELALRLEEEGRDTQAQAQARLHPWQQQPLHSARARFQHLNLAALSAIWPVQLPATQMDGELELVTQSNEETKKENISKSSFEFSIQIQNTLYGPWDAQRLPLQSARARVQYDGQRWRWQGVRLVPGPGAHITLADGYYNAASGALEGDIQWLLAPASLHGQLAALPGQQGRGQLHGQLDGRLDFSLHVQRQDQLDDTLLVAGGHWQAPQLALERLEIDALHARVQASQLQWDGARVQAGQIQASVPGMQLQAQGHMGAVAGAGHAEVALTSPASLGQWLGEDVQALTAALPGGKGIGQALRDVARHLRPWTVEPPARLQMDWQGGWGGLQKRFAARPGQTMAPDPLQLRLALALPELQYRDGPEGLRLRALQLQWSGGPDQGDVDLQASARYGGHSLRLDTRGRAGLGSAAADWHLALDALQLQWQPPGAQPPPHWTLHLDTERGPLQLGQSGQQHTLGPGRLRLGHSAAPNAAHLQWEATQVEWLPTALPHVRSSGRVENFPLPWAAALAAAVTGTPQLGVDAVQDIVLGAHWRMDSAGSAQASCGPQAELTLERSGGDLRLMRDEALDEGPQDAQASAGLERARLHTRFDCGQVQAELDWRSLRAGQVQASLGSRLEPTPWGGWHWPQQAALDGRVQASVPDLGVLGRFMPPGWRLGGSVQVQASIAGTSGQPDWQGQVRADDVHLRSIMDGVALQDGLLRATFRGTRLHLDELRLHGGPGSQAHIAGPGGNLSRPAKEGGELRASGQLFWQPPAQEHPGGLEASVQLEAHQLQLLARADRQLSLSGSLRSNLQAGQWALQGRLMVDRASIIAPDASAPALDEDVIVLHEAPDESPDPAPEAQEGTAWPLPKMHIALDLGPDFALQGHGLTTRLAGSLDIEADPQWPDSPRLGGEIHTRQGRYRAWGQMLDVDSGLLRFGGPPDNPALDILALRPNIAVRAGVRIQGTARAPRVGLHSEPAMADAETLSWLLTGRDPAAGGATSALLQQAAMALLGREGDGSGQMATRLGLDEIGLSAGGAEAEEGGPALNLGKRLSSDLYVTWEQSLGSAMGTLYLFYDLGRNLTLRAQGGLTSALDVIYTLRHD